MVVVPMFAAGTMGPLGLLAVAGCYGAWRLARYLRG